MIINKAHKKRAKWLPSLILALALSISGSVYAAGTSVAHISPGSSSATGTPVKATGTSGTLEVSSSGPAFYVQGYAKKQIDWWPDSTVASAIAYPSQTVTKYFTAESGSYYYAQAYTQANATSIYGEARVKVN